MLVAVANDLHHQRIGKAFRVTGHEHQTTTRNQLGIGALHQRCLNVEAGQQAVAGQVMTQRQGMDLVVNTQRARGMHKGLITKTVERFGIAGRGDDRRAADQAALLGIFKHEEITFLAIETDLGGKRRLRGHDLLAQALVVIRQRGHPHRAVRRQATDIGQVGQLSRTQDEHRQTP